LLGAATNPSVATQLASAIPLALAACVYPPAIAVLIYYFSRESGKRLVFAYFAGAFAMTLVVGIVGILALGEAEINPRDHPTPNAALDIALGLAMLAAAVLVANRKGPRGRDAKPPSERQASTRSAVLLGVVMYAPSLFYLSAMKQVAEADPSALGAVLIALLLTVCVLLFLEVPIALYLLFPEATDDKLKVFDAWMHRAGRGLLIWGFTIGGLYMLGTGLYLLARS
jgi:threonine/homoserine/homoserine lactone efflux protein